MNATQLSKLRKAVEAEIRKAQPDLAGEPFKAAVQTEVNKRVNANPTTTTAVTKDTKTESAKAVTKAVAPTKPASPEGWRPVDNSHKSGVALRYSRRARGSGHIINIWDSTHDETPKDVKAAPGEGKYVVHDTVSGAMKRANEWNMAYTISRTIDGGTVPETVKYLRPWQSKLAKSGS